MVFVAGEEDAAPLVVGDDEGDWDRPGGPPEGVGKTYEAQQGDAAWLEAGRAAGDSGGH